MSTSYVENWMQWYFGVVVKLDQCQKIILKSMTLIAVTFFLLWPKSSQLVSFLLWLLSNTSIFIILILKMHFFIVNLKKKFIWSNLMVLLLKRSLVWFASFVNLAMVWSYSHRHVLGNWFRYCKVLFFIVKQIIQFGRWSYLCSSLCWYYHRKLSC